MAKKKKASTSKPGRGELVDHLPQFLDRKALETLCGLLREQGVSDLEWAEGEKSLVLRFGGGKQSAPVMHASIHAPSAPPPVKAETPTAAKPAAPVGKMIHSPFVGTFYRAPSPEAQPYVNEGSKIKPGDVLCVIEAMKLMNEIEAEISGNIKQILVENGQPIEFGEPLFLVE